MSNRPPGGMGPGPGLYAGHTELVVPVQPTLPLPSHRKSGEGGAARLLPQAVSGSRGGGMALVPVWHLRVTVPRSFCVQWLQQIEETESALQRRMVDLESEKVGGRRPRGL